MVGELKEINLDDPARTVVLELEANNFEDAEGNPLALKSMNNEVSSLCIMLFMYTDLISERDGQATMRQSSLSF